MIRFFEEPVLNSEHSNSLFHHTRFIYVVLSVLLFVSALLFLNYGESRTSFQSSVRHIESTIRQADKGINAEISKFESKSNRDFFAYFNDNSKFLDARGLSYFVFENDSLIAWSSSAVPGAERLP